MTSYNHERFIKESIESILNQTFKDFELIIVDDCSKDSSFEIINSFNDKRIIKIRNKINKGPEYAFEILHKTAKGQFIAIADSDNVWELDKLQKQLSFLESNPNYAAVFTKANIINENSEPYANKKAIYYTIFNVENRSRQEWLNHFFYKGNCLCHPSVLIRREAYKECQMVVDGLWQIPDLYKWIRLCFKYEIFILDDKLINFRIHKNNITGENNLENVLRASNELYNIYNLFYEINEEDFLLVFKEASKFVVNGNINIKFALSKLLLSLGIPALQTLALNKLFEMLNNSEERTQIFELYNYDDVSYKNDETIYAPFALSNCSYYNNIHKAKLYVDLGNGFNKTDVITKDFITDTNGNFQIDFKGIDILSQNKNIKGLRFDPCCCFSKIKIKNICSNSRKNIYEINKSSLLENEYSQKEGYDIFYTDDPSYIITDFGTSPKDLSILGVISPLNNLELAKLKNLEIEEAKNEINKLKNEKENLLIINENNLRNIYNSLSWRITKPLRIIKKFLIK